MLSNGRSFLFYYTHIEIIKNNLMLILIGRNEIKTIITGNKCTVQSKKQYFNAFNIKH